MVASSNNDRFTEIIGYGNGILFKCNVLWDVTIGMPGNVADTTGFPNPAGAVGYAYNIGKYEVSRDMVTKANASGSLGISLQDMTSSGGNGANRPATGIQWNEAARFVNWLNTGTGGFAAYKFMTSDVIVAFAKCFEQFGRSALRFVLVNTWTGRSARPTFSR